MEGIFAEQVRPVNCKKCRAQRRHIIKYDRKGKPIEKDKKYGEFSDILVGFCNHEKMGKIKAPIDILIVADSHGGGRKESFINKQETLKDSADRLKKYYYGKWKDLGWVTFHQYEIHKLLNNISDKNWFFTDLVKCYIDRIKQNGQDNMHLAGQCCYYYLKKQIRVMKPKIILLLGWRVRSAFEMDGLVKINENDKRKTISELHGRIYKGNDNRTYYIYSVFPSQRTADIWTKVGGWKKVFGALSNPNSNIN